MYTGDWGEVLGNTVFLVEFAIPVSLLMGPEDVELVEAGQGWQGRTRELAERMPIQASNDDHDANEH